MWWGSIPAIPPNGPSPLAPIGNWEKQTNQTLAYLQQCPHPTQQLSAQSDMMMIYMSIVAHIWSAATRWDCVYHSIHVVTRVGWIWYKKCRNNRKVKQHKHNHAHTHAHTHTYAGTHRAYLLDLALSGSLVALHLLEVPEMTVFSLCKIHSWSNKDSLCKFEIQQTYHITSRRSRRVRSLSKYRRKSWKTLNICQTLLVTFYWNTYWIGVWRIWPGSTPTRSPGIHTHTDTHSHVLLLASFFVFSSFELATTSSSVAQER